jgi:hypothetical protein
MKENKEIFLPDTTVRYDVLKKNLKDIYGIELISSRTKWTFIAFTGTLLLYLILKK